MRINSGMTPRAAGMGDVEAQIHRMEIEAYGAVLRAFSAQSDVLSWGKESLISELRKELRVSDVEHREILAKVNSDESITTIRESRQSSDVRQGLVPSTANAFGFPSSVINIPRKKPKAINVSISTFPPYLSHDHPPLSTLSPPLLTNVREDSWGKSTPVFPPQVSNGHSRKSLNYHRQATNTGKGWGSFTIQIPRTGFGQFDNDASKPDFDTIEIRGTDMLIDEIERICGVENPDLAKIEQAKSILKDHERALLDALDKLANLPDDASGRLHCFSTEEFENNEKRFTGVSDQLAGNRGC